MKKKKYIFLLTLSLLLPLLMLFLMEAGLRAVHYGTNLDDLFLTTPDGQYLYLNKDISKRYFTISQATTGNIQFFRKKKGGHTIRMFVLGESAAMGFPYPNNISFQRMLKYQLQKDYPQKEVEIINLSLTAINSYTFYDFGKELAQYQPDAILIYGGHNEYYGALGVGSTSTFGSNPSLVRCIIRLRQTRLVQLLEQLVEKIKPTSLADTSDNLMKYVVKEQLIKYQSPIFYKGISQFEKNMRDLLTLFERDDIPVFWSTVATNLKDQYPFRSLFAAGTDSAFYKKQLYMARTHFQHGELQPADSLVASLYESDPDNADCAYLRGQIKLAIGEHERAFQFFNEAKQKDGLRFRAPDEINDVIRQLSNQYKNVRLVEAEQSFKKESEAKIPGRKLLLEHVHPTIEGHRVIARSFLSAIQESGLLGAEENSNHTKPDYSLNTFPVLEFDSLAGEYACMQLRKGFPFYEQVAAIQTETPVEKLAMQYTREKNWYNSMEQLHKYAVSSKDYPLALHVLKVRIIDNEYDTSFYNQAGEICMILHKYPDALAYYEKSFGLYRTFPVAQEIISCALRCDKPEVATGYMEYAIANNQTAMNFRVLKDYCMEIIRCKKQLEASPPKEMYRRIAEIYTLIGNAEVADTYKEAQLHVNNQ